MRFVVWNFSGTSNVSTRIRGDGHATKDEQPNPNAQDEPRAVGLQIILSAFSPATTHVVAVQNPFQLVKMRGRVEGGRYR